MFTEFASKLTPDKRPALIAYGTIDAGADYWIMVAENEKPDYYIVIPFRLVYSGKYKPTKVKAGQKKSVVDLLKEAGLPQTEKQDVYVQWVNKPFFFSQ